jgi:hypothetical protein
MSSALAPIERRRRPIAPLLAPFHQRARSALAEFKDMLAALASSALEVLRPTDSRGAAIFWNHMAACGDAQDAWTMMRRHRTFTAR